MTELVERRRWISERRFLHALNFCMALPGPEAQQLASYIGYSLYGVRGAITSGGLFVLPSFVVLCVMSAVYVEYGDVAVVDGAVQGLGAAVVALVLAAVIRVGGRVIHTTAAACARGSGLRRDRRRHAVSDRHRSRRAARLRRRTIRRRPLRYTRRARRRGRARHRRQRPALVASCCRRPGGLAGPGRPAHPGRRRGRRPRRVLHACRPHHFRRRLRGAAVRREPCRQPLRLAYGQRHGRRSGPRRVDARPADHGEHVRRVPRRLQRRGRPRHGAWPGRPSPPSPRSSRASSSSSPARRSSIGSARAARSPAR